MSLISYHPQFSFSPAFLRKTLPPFMYPIKFNNFYNDITFHLSLLILHFKFISQLRKIRSRSWLSISIKILIKIQILVLHRYFIDTSLFPSIFSSCIDKNFIHYSTNFEQIKSLSNPFPIYSQKLLSPSIHLSNKAIPHYTPVESTPTLSRTL